jgi:hypothetical protein
MSGSRFLLRGFAATRHRLVHLRQCEQKVDHLLHVQAPGVVRVVIIVLGHFGHAFHAKEIVIELAGVGPHAIVVTQIVG